MSNEARGSSPSSLFWPNLIAVAAVTIIAGWLVLVGAWLHNTNLVANEEQHHLREMHEDIHRNRQNIELVEEHLKKQDAQTAHQDQQMNQVLSRVNRIVNLLSKPKDSPDQETPK